MRGDLKKGPASDWLVTGWFTPDYRPLAEKFATNLAEHGVPYHLWAMPSAGAWNTRRKPSIVRETMNTYPGRTVVLMDVDCVVRGDIAPVVNTETDIGIIVIGRNMKKGSKFRHWIAAECSSRIVVFRPTEGAREFVRRWAEQIDRSEFNHDEHSMVWALLASLPTTRFSYIDQRYSARELGQISDAVIEHDSAHDEQRRAQRGPFKLALRQIERRLFRTGRTRKLRLKGEMSVLLQGMA
jgi:hypothetical protein